MLKWLQIQMCDNDAVMLVVIRIAAFLRLRLHGGCHDVDAAGDGDDDDDDVADNDAHDDDDDNGWW